MKKTKRCAKCGRLRARVRELERRLRKITCIDCGGSELRHKPKCPWRKAGDP